MPFLRMSPDNTLAETLGNLGSSLAQNFNPMAQVQSQSMLEQIQQRRWELQQKMNQDEANRQAANDWVLKNPLNQDPATRDLTAAQIRAGNNPLGTSTEAIIAGGKYKASQAAAAALRNDPRTKGWTDAEYSEAGARILNGADMGDVIKQRAEGALAAGKTAAVTGAASEARAAGGPIAEAETYTDPAKAAELVARARLRGTQIDPSAPDAAAQKDKLSLDMREAGYTPPPLGQALLPSLQSEEDKQRAAAGGEAELLRKSGELLATGIPPTGNYFPFGLPGSATNPFPSFTPRPSGEISVKDESSPSATPMPVVRQVGEGPGAIVGEPPAEAKQRGDVNTANRASLQEAVDSGVAGRKMISLLDRLDALAQIADTGGSGQIPTAIAAYLADRHIRVTDRQAILAEMQSLFNAQIPELRKDMGVKFEAGPELSAQGKMIGDPSMPTQVIRDIIARQRAIANLGVQRRELAMRALYPEQTNPLSMPQYQQEEAKLYDNLSAATQEEIKAVGGYGTQPPPTPPPAMNSNSATNAFQSLFRWLGGANNPQPAPAAPGAATEQWDVDAQGRPVRVR